VSRRRELLRSRRRHQIHGLLERIRSGEKRIDDCWRDREATTSHLVEQGLELVGQLANGRITHGGAHSLHRVDRTKEPCNGRVAPAALQLEQRGIDLREVFATLGEEELGVAAGIHLG